MCDHDPEIHAVLLDALREICGGEHSDSYVFDPSKFSPEQIQMALPVIQKATARLKETNKTVKIVIPKETILQVLDVARSIVEQLQGGVSMEFDPAALHSLFGSMAVAP